MYVSGAMYLFAEGYHAGRMSYEYAPPADKLDEDYYKAGYEYGIEDRNEQDERN